MGEPVALQLGKGGTAVPLMAIAAVEQRRQQRGRHPGLPAAPPASGAPFSLPAFLLLHLPNWK